MAFPRTRTRRARGGAPPADVLARAQRGDHAALDELCRAEWRTVYAVVARRVGSRHEAEDVTQEVFLRALRNLDGYRSESGSFRPYLVTIARNLLRDRWRSERRAAPAVDTDPDSLAGRERGPEAAALAAEERATLAAGLARLSALHRQVLRLRVLEGRPSAEVAATLGRSPEAVRQLQHRALEALRAALDDDPHEGRSDDG